MRLFAGRIEHSLNVTVQRLHDADARKHRRAAVRRDQDQGRHCRLPLRRRVLGLRKLGDIGARVLEGEYPIENQLLKFPPSKTF
jgi:hypothetical protein